MYEKLNDWLFGIAVSIAGPIILSFQNIGTKEKIIVFCLSVFALIVLNLFNKVFIPIIANNIKARTIREKNEYEAINKYHDDYVEELCRMKIPEVIRYDAIVKDSIIHPIDPDFKKYIDKIIIKIERYVAFDKEYTRQKAFDALSPNLNYNPPLKNKDIIIRDIIEHSEYCIKQTKRREKLGKKLGELFIYK